MLADQGHIGLCELDVIQFLFEAAHHINGANALFANLSQVLWIVPLSQDASVYGRMECFDSTCDTSFPSEACVSSY